MPKAAIANCPDCGSDAVEIPGRSLEWLDHKFACGSIIAADGTKRNHKDCLCNQIRLLREQNRLLKENLQLANNAHDLVITLLESLGRVDIEPYLSSGDGDTYFNVIQSKSGDYVDYDRIAEVIQIMKIRRQ